MRSGITFKAPRVGEVYNLGGSRHSNCSMLEAIDLCEEISGRELSWTYVEDNRIGDHIWWISDVAKFQGHYPEVAVSLRHSRDPEGNPCRLPRIKTPQRHRLPGCASSSRRRDEEGCIASTVEHLHVELALRRVLMRSWSSMMAAAIAPGKSSQACSAHTWN